MRLVNFAIALTLVVAVASCRQIAPRSGSADRPNVLLVTIDTLRADHVGSYGYQAASTPTIDAARVCGSKRRWFIRR